MFPPNVFTAAHFEPVHRSTREEEKETSLANAHTSDGEVAAAKATYSVLLPGNAACFQVLPVRCHAVSPPGDAKPLNAHAVVFPVATTAVKSPFALVLIDLTMCQWGAAA